MCLAAVGLMLVFPSWALAHESATHSDASVFAGFAHPFSGLDHLFFMFAFGFILSRYSKLHRLGMFVGFILSMLAGAVLAITSVWVTPVENGILLSLLVGACLLGFRTNLPLLIVYALIGVSGSIHGIAHGLELPKDAMVLSYIVGFVLAFTLILSAGLVLCLKLPTSNVRKWCGRGISLALLACVAFSI